MVAVHGGPGDFSTAVLFHYGDQFLHRCLHDSARGVLGPSLLSTGGSLTPTPQLQFVEFHKRGFVPPGLGGLIAVANPESRTFSAVTIKELPSKMPWLIVHELPGSQGVEASHSAEYLEYNNSYKRPPAWRLSSKLGRSVASNR